MLSEEQRCIIKAATVALSDFGGQGVLVPGGLILTAAHCVKWSYDGGMAMGDRCFHRVVTAEGKSLVADVEAVEGRFDIAILGAPDPQEYHKLGEAYLEFCENTMAVDLCTDEPVAFESFEVFILSHRGHWIRAEATLCAEASPQLFLRFDAKIEGGTSGGPIVNVRGQLVGIVSNASDDDLDDMLEGSCPRPCVALPVWAVNRITAASE